MKVLGWFVMCTVVPVLGCLFSCGGGGGGGGSDGTNVVASNLRRDTNPSVTASETEELVRGNSQFAFDLYHAISGRRGNLFYSPYSISLALAMTYAGARGNTERQMADTMHFTLPQDKLHRTFNALDLVLRSRGEGARGKDNEGFKLRIVNSIWGEKTYTFLPAFLDVLAVNYGAGLRLVDFMNAPDPSRVIINNWVEQQTEGRIPDLIPQGIIDTYTRLVLVNAIYFNAAWANPFEEELTRDGDFFLLDGGKVTVPLMEQTEEFRYAEGDGWKAAELPYDKYELSMLILLPDLENFENFERSLDSGMVQSVVDSLESREVHLTMPRFRTEAEFMLSDALKSMGMTDAFEPGIADLSGMDGTHDLFIQEVVHKAFVDVDEEGTEAAAATAVIIGFTSAPMPSEPVEFRVDHPFIFLIRDRGTGAILFVGRIVNPR